MQQPPNTTIAIIVGIGLLLIAYMWTSSYKTHEDEDKSVSLCHVHAQIDELDDFDDRALLQILAVFKVNDFRIGQPVWGPANNLLYLCEHKLKVGLKHSMIDQELHAVMKEMGAAAKSIAWSCA